MVTYTIDKDNPPPFKGTAAYFERSCNPFAPAIINEALGGPTADKTDTGWCAVDWGENVIGFFADGTTVEVTEREAFEITPGYFKDDRMFAYPKTEWIQSTRKNHDVLRAKMLIEKETENARIR